jgi:hypothetical protein
MEENLVLISFVCLPIIIAAILYLFFSKFSAYFGKIQWLKLIVGNLLVFLFLCSVIVLGGEIYYRYIYDKTDAWGLTKVYLKWISRHYRFNNFGLRDSVDYQPKIQGKPRITFIGDSFTQGSGVADVEKCFVNRIRAARPDWEIHCFAKSGWNTYDYMSYISEAVKEGYEFDHIVLIYNLNDISDIMEHWKEVLYRIYFVNEPSFIFKHSYFLNLLYYHYISPRDSDFANYYNYILDAYNGPVWEKNKWRLSLLKPYFDSEDIDFMVVTFPFLHNIWPDYKYRKAHEKLDVFWKDANVPNLDLLPVFEKHRPKDLIVHSNDPHPNELAHEIAAKAILEFLDKNMKTRSKAVTATAPIN